MSRAFWNAIGLLAFVAALMGAVYLIGEFIEAARASLLQL